MLPISAFRTLASISRESTRHPDGGSHVHVRQARVDPDSREVVLQLGVREHRRDRSQRHPELELHPIGARDDRERAIRPRHCPRSTSTTAPRIVFPMATRSACPRTCSSARLRTSSPDCVVADLEIGGQLPVDPWTIDVDVCFSGELNYQEGL